MHDVTICKYYTKTNHPVIIESEKIEYLLKRQKVVKQTIQYLDFIHILIVKSHKTN